LKWNALEEQSCLLPPGGVCQEQHLSSSQPPSLFTLRLLFNALYNLAMAHKNVDYRYQEPTKSYMNKTEEKVFAVYE